MMGRVPTTVSSHSLLITRRSRMAAISIEDAADNRSRGRQEDQHQRTDSRPRQREDARDDANGPYQDQQPGRSMPPPTSAKTPSTSR